MFLSRRPGKIFVSAERKKMRSPVFCPSHVEFNLPFDIFIYKLNQAVGHFALLLDVRMSGCIFIGYEVSVYFNVI